MSMICSLALRAGLHRDPSHFPELSVFECEMRRRTWLCIRQFDLLCAWQLGLRTNIQSAWTDTRPPLNLRDEDFDEYMPELPPPRPDNDLTGIIFDIAKDDLYRAIERILFEQLKSKHIAEEAVWQLDADLRKSYDKIPSILKLDPSGNPSPGDSPEHIFMKVKTSLLFNKSLCAVHRSNMNTHNRSQQQSLNICVQAATNCLANMVYVFEESIQGGRLCRDRWMRTSVHSSDFFYAASILCWLLAEKRRNPGLECPFIDQNKQQVLNNLVRAQQICEDQSYSPEARQVSKALRFILDRSVMLALYPPPTQLDQRNGSGGTSYVPKQGTGTGQLNGNHGSAASQDNNGQTMATSQLDGLFTPGQENFDWVSECIDHAGIEVLTKVVYD